MPGQKLIEVFGKGPVSIARAPGRVNLIGDHTDYNGGYVLPAAVDREVRIAFRPSGDARVEMVSADFEERAAFDLGGVARGQAQGWAKYPAGVAAALQAEKYPVAGLRAVIQGNVPVGAGLSSSAAIEVACALAFCSVSGLKIDREKLAHICQRAENEFVGMQCGIMDQYACLLGRKDCALFLDCTTLQSELVPLDERGAKIVICDTRLKRQLVNSAYNRRRGECEEAFRILKQHLPDAKSYKDISIPMFRAYAHDLPDPLGKRAKHVVTENARVVQAARLLKKGDLIGFGALMDASHDSLRDDFEVSCKELDLLVGIARESEGVFGSRMTGAGFGGCTVALVRPDCVEAFTAKISEGYRADTGAAPGIYIVRASEGATYENAEGRSAIEESPRR
ncbi:MAG: galactokinase [Candidatus Brocadiia bacterium]|jgi:galactokinase